DELVKEGTAGVIVPEVKVIPMNDLKLVEAELATKEYAIVMTEGGGAHMAGQIPWDTEFIQALPALTKKYRTLWLIDEVVTGFRDATGGWQSLVGVEPDMTTLGKCTGGGLPVGAVVGRADILGVLDPKLPMAHRVRHTGTWNANPLLCSAGIAACKVYYPDGEPQKKAAELGAYLREQGNKVLRGKGISGRFYSRSMVHLYLGSIDYEPSDPNLPPTKSVQKIMDPAMAGVKEELCLRLLQRGIANMG
ncbi:unnamed protein product, partial [marine sediment metagenome]